MAEHGAPLAHDAQHGHDMWASLHMGAGELGVAVADAGADDLAARLATECRVPLYGVHFDFNKATLHPESDPVLTRVLNILTNRGTQPARRAGKGCGH